MNITAQDVKIRWDLDLDPMTIPDAVLETFVEDAKTIITHEFPTVEARIVANELNLGVVKLVVVAMVMRAIKVGWEYRSSVGQTQGPFGMNVGFGDSGSNARRGIFLTDHERTMLAPRENSNSIFSVSTGEPTYAYTEIPEWWRA